MSLVSPGAGAGSAYDRVERALLSEIEDGRYLVGARLPPQRDLAERFGVSRDTVQRVLRALQDEGFIESRQGSGSRVIRAPSGREGPAKTDERSADLAPRTRAGRGENAGSPPAYDRIERGLLSRIEAGTYTVGTRLPTQRELAREFGTGVGQLPAARRSGSEAAG